MRRLSVVCWSMVSVICLLLPGLALASDPEALHEKGVVAYDRGDVTAAMGSFRRAAEMGHVPSQVRLGYVLDIAGMDAQAEAWFRKAAEKGSAEGHFWLARLYATGESGNMDIAKALKHYRAASRTGYGQATVVLANAREDGALGLQPDAARARELWRLAVEQGEPEAALRLTNAHENGELGLPADPEAAARWDRRLQEMGGTNSASDGEEGDGTQDPQ